MPFNAHRCAHWHVLIHTQAHSNRRRHTPIETRTLACTPCITCTVWHKQTDAEEWSWHFTFFIGFQMFHCLDAARLFCTPRQSDIGLSVYLLRVCKTLKEKEIAFLIYLQYVDLQRKHSRGKIERRQKLDISKSDSTLRPEHGHPKVTSFINF